MYCVTVWTDRRCRVQLYRVLHQSREDALQLLRWLELHSYGGSRHKEIAQRG